MTQQYIENVCQELRDGPLLADELHNRVPEWASLRALMAGRIRYDSHSRMFYLTEREYEQQSGRD